MSKIQAVCFDAFGTLVEIGDKRRPFRTLLSGQHLSHRTIDALTQPLGLREVAKDLAIVIGEARLQELELDLAAECISIRLRSGMQLLWAVLRQADVRIGVCSNLAQPYAAPLLASLPGIPDALILSFEVGFIKPQPEIFQFVCQRLGLAAEQILFVGDTLEADILGPRAIGMHAISITSFEAAVIGNAAQGCAVEEQPTPPVRQMLERLRQCVCS